MKPKPFFLVIVFTLVLFSPVSFAETTTTTPTPVELRFHQDWLNGVVIVAYQNQYGTGFWINPTHIATAAHVVGFDSHAVVQVIRGSVTSTGQVVALDRQTDIAVIYVQNAAAFRNKHIFPIARSMPEPTSTIYVIGYPAELLQILGNLQTLSENPRVLESSLTWSANGLIELGGITDAGNSGGPVVDYSGNVIGVVSFAMRGEAGTLYFASSAGNLKQLCEQYNIAYEQGTSGILPSDDPAIAGAIAGATASVATDIVIVFVAAFAGAALLAKKRGGRR